MQRNGQCGTTLNGAYLTGATTPSPTATVTPDSPATATASAIARQTDIAEVRATAYAALAHLDIVRWEGSVHRHFMVPLALAERLCATSAFVDTHITPRYPARRIR